MIQTSASGLDLKTRLFNITYIERSTATHRAITGTQGIHLRFHPDDSGSMFLASYYRYIHTTPAVIHSTNETFANTKTLIKERKDRSNARAVYSLL